MGQGYLPNFKIPRYPRGELPRNSHPRRSSNVTSCYSARPVRNPGGWLPRSHRSKCTTTAATAFLIHQHAPWRTNEGKDKDELKHLTIGIFIYKRQRGNTQRAELNRLSNANNVQQRALNNSYLQTAPKDTHTYTQIPQRRWTSTVFFRISSRVG